MTMSWPHGTEKELAAPPVTNVPPDSTLGLLHSILDAIKDIGPQAAPATGILNLSPDAIQGPNNGRILQRGEKLRLQRIVLMASGAVTFTLMVGGTIRFGPLPATPAGVFTLIDMPFPELIDRGANIQIVANAATWAGYAIFTPE